MVRRPTRQEHIDIQRRIPTQHVLGTSEDIVDIRMRNDAQRHLAIDSAEGHVIDLVAKRRHVRALGRVHLHNQYVLRILVNMLRQLERKWSEPAAIFSEANSIDPHRRRRHDAFKVDKDALSRRAARQFEPPSIGRDEFVFLIVEVMPGQLDVGMRNDYALKLCVVEIGCLRSIDLRRAIAPVAIHGQNIPALCSFFL